MEKTKEEKIKNKIKNGEKLIALCFGKEKYLKYSGKRYKLPRYQYSKFVFVDMDGNVLEFLTKEIIINIHKMKKDNVYEISYSNIEHKFIFNRVENDLNLENIEGIVNEIKNNKYFWTDGKDIENECKYEKDIIVTNRMGEIILLFALFAFIVNKPIFIAYFMFIDFVYYFGQRYNVLKNLLKLYKRKGL